MSQNDILSLLKWYLFLPPIILYTLLTSVSLGLFISDGVEVPSLLVGDWDLATYSVHL